MGDDPPLCKRGKGKRFHFFLASSNAAMEPPLAERVAVAMAVGFDRFDPGPQLGIEQ